MRRPITLLAAGFAAFAALSQTAAAPIEGDALPSTWIYAQSADSAFSSVLNTSAPASDRWWSTFTDPTLDSLVDMAVSANYDVAIATQRIEIARQGLRQARSAYYPTLQLNGGWTQARSSGLAQRRHGNAVTTSSFDLGVDMSWEIDAFGKVTARARESKAAVEVSKAEFDAVMLSVAAKVANAYIQLRVVQAEEAVLQRNIDSQQKVLTITRARFEAGLSSKLDVSQAATTYYSTLASLTSLRKQESASVCALAVLLGCYPHELEPMLQSSGSALPDYHRIVAVGVPMELLRRRPDLLQAERTIDQQAAALGVAKSDYLPSLSLGGSIYTQAHNAADLFKDQSFGYSVAPKLSWTIFSGFSRAAATAQARRQMEVAVDSYNLTVVTAVSEAESAMTSYLNDLQYIDHVTQVVKDATESFTLSLDLYKQGLTDFINVSNAQISMLQYANELVVAHGTALTDLVALYQALGGTF